MIERLVIVAAVVAVAMLAGRWWRARQGRVRVTGEGGDSQAGGVQALLFTTPTCRTCPHVRANLAAVATAHPGFTWREVDAAVDPDTARGHRVLRAPTVVFHTSDGAEVARASGVVSAIAIATAARLSTDEVCTAG